MLGISSISSVHYSVDKAVLKRISQESGTAVQEEIRVEDVMSYIGFIKEKAGLGDQSAVADNVRILAEKLSPWFLGSIYRTHSHIRLIAQKLLGCHITRIDEQRANIIVESLAEKTYLHGHAIGRREAQELGLPIEHPNEQEELLLWQLFEEYERVMGMRQPIDLDVVLGPDRDEGGLPLTLATIESTPSCSAFRGELRLRRIRQAPAQVNINVNLGVTLPQGIDPALVPQEIIQQLVQQVQQAVPTMVTEQTRRQSPVLRTEGRLQGASWQDVTAEGI